MALWDRFRKKKDGEPSATPKPSQPSQPAEYTIGGVEFKITNERDAIGIEVLSDPQKTAGTIIAHMCNQLSERFTVARNKRYSGGYQLNTDIPVLDGRGPPDFSNVLELCKAWSGKSLEEIAELRAEPDRQRRMTETSLTDQHAGRVEQIAKEKTRPFLDAVTKFFEEKGIDAQEVRTRRGIFEGVFAHAYHDRVAIEPYLAAVEAYCHGKGEPLTPDDEKLLSDMMQQALLSARRSGPGF